VTAALPIRQRVFSIWDAVTTPSAVNVAISVVLAAVFAAVTAVVTLSATPTYSSSATLAIDQPGAIARSADTGVIEKLDRLRLKYSGLVGTLPIERGVAASTGISVDDLDGHLSARVGPESLLIHPTATATKPATASRLADALADEITKYAASEQVRDGIPNDQRFVFEAVEPADHATKISPTAAAATALAALGALFGLGVAYVVLQVLTANRRLA
jgi:capsular polysaccharide biosynthesis protein